MKFPIDKSQLTFMCAAPARPATDYETKQPRIVVVTGELLFDVQAQVIDTIGAQVIRVRVPSDPNVAPGDVLELDGLVAAPWSVGDRSGVAFRANRILPGAAVPDTTSPEGPNAAA